MATTAVKLPVICRSVVGGMRRNGILVQRQYEGSWSWRRGVHGLPEDGSVSYLRNSVNGAEVYLVGTNHISGKSAQLVKQVIGFVNPNIIAVELCKRRAQSLQRLKYNQASLLKLYFNSWKFPGGPHKKLLHFSLHLFYHILRIIGFEPGKEFKIALEECKRLEAQLLLMDEDIDVTTGKLGDALSFRCLLRIIKNKMGREELAGNVELQDLIKNKSKNKEELEKFARNVGLRDLIENMIENTSERNIVRKVREDLTSDYPEIARAFITHRDQVMFEHLRKCNGKVVAVVGMGHMDGLEQMWKDVEQNVHKIDG